MLLINPAQNDPHDPEGKKFVPEFGHCINACSTYGVFPADLDHEPNCTYGFYRKKDDVFFRAIIVALKDLNPGDVLYADYGKTYWEAWARAHKAPVSMAEAARVSAGISAGVASADGVMELVEPKPLRHDRGIGAGILNSCAFVQPIADMLLALEPSEEEDLLKFKFLNVISSRFHEILGTKNYLLGRAFEQVKGQKNYPYILLHKAQIMPFIQAFLEDPSIKLASLPGYQNFATQMANLVPELGIKISSPERELGMQSWEVLPAREEEKTLAYRLINLRDFEWVHLRCSSSRLGCLIRELGGSLDGSPKKAQVFLPTKKAAKIIKKMAELRHLNHIKSLAEKFKKASPERLQTEIVFSTQIPIDRLQDISAEQVSVTKEKGCLIYVLPRLDKKFFSEYMQKQNSRLFIPKCLEQCDGEAYTDREDNYLKKLKIPRAQAKKFFKLLSKSKGGGCGGAPTFFSSAESGL